MKWLIFIVSIIFFAGCIPIPIPYGPYYEPSYDEASSQTIREGCHGQAGPLSGLKFLIADGVAVENYTASPSSYPNLDHPVVIAITIPKNTTFQFLSDTIEINSTSDISKIYFPKKLRVISHFELNRDGTFNSHDLYPINKTILEENGQKPFYGLYYFSKDENNETTFKTRKIELILPDIMMENDKHISFEPIVMESENVCCGPKYTSKRVREERLEIYNKCLKETPELSCKYFLDRSGFKVNTEDFNISGEIGIRNGFINFGVRDMIVYSSSRWNFLTDKVRIKDLESGVEKRITIVSLHGYSGSFYIPFTESITSPRHVQDGHTKIFIEGSLDGMMASEIWLQLPDCLIEGKKIKFKPIKLHLKVFDGEFPPFNC